MVSNAQLLLANGVLRVARQERGRRRVSLPLTARNEPLTAADNPIDLNLRLITMLQTQRDGILGYGQHVSMDDMQEWIFACKAMGQLFGGPLAFVIEPTFMPEPPKIRYRVTDLLETHAHVLSSMWLMLPVDRMDGDAISPGRLYDWRTSSWWVRTPRLPSSFPGSRGRRKNS